MLRSTSAANATKRNMIAYTLRDSVREVHGGGGMNSIRR
jgi:hypothetical protein